MSINLSSLDLNLLVLLDAVLEEKNVTRAGARVGLSQPAASNALKRLRHLLGDPLLEKDGRRLRLTERGHQFRAPLREALDKLKAVLDEPLPFDPKTSPFRVRLMASDHVTLVLMPRLHQRLSQLAPRAEIVVLWTHTEPPVELLEREAIDLAIGRYYNTPNAIRRVKLYDETLVVQARKGHPIFDSDLTAAEFGRFPRIATSFDGRIFGDQEQAMARAGIEVKSAIVMPHLIAAPMLTLGNDLVTIAPQRMAERLSSLLALDWRPLPFASPSVPMEMMWHEKTTADPALAWFRRLVVDLGAEL